MLFRRIRIVISFEVAFNNIAQRIQCFALIRTLSKQELNISPFRGQGEKQGNQSSAMQLQIFNRMPPARQLNMPGMNMPNSDPRTHLWNKFNKRKNEPGNQRDKKLVTSTKCSITGVSTSRNNMQSVYLKIALKIALKKEAHPFKVVYSDFRADGADRLNHKADPCEKNINLFK